MGKLQSDLDWNNFNISIHERQLKVIEKLNFHFSMVISNNGSTSLHFAVTYGQIEVVKLLFLDFLGHFQTFWSL